jgi:hypothetical protein
MSDFLVTLGGVVLDGFEIPDRIKGGGKQVTRTKRYAGGARSVDTFGPDDAPLQWSGMFLDEDAEDRCQQLDAMRVAGEQIELSWSSFSYQVVITDFTWDHEKFYQIPYSITLEVVEDQAQAQPDDGEDPETVMQGDADDIAEYQDALGGTDSGLDDLLDGITSTIASVPSITGASATFLSGLSSQLQGAIDYVDPLIAAQDAALGALADLPGGGSPDLVVSTLMAADAASDACANYFGLRNSMRRLQRNVQAVAA